MQKKVKIHRFRKVAATGRYLAGSPASWSVRSKIRIFPPSNGKFPIAVPATATEIRQAVGVSKADLQAALHALDG